MDIANASWSAKLTIPVLALVGFAYAAAPALGLRHATNTGEIAKCNATLTETSKREFESKAARIRSTMPETNELSLSDIIKLVIGSYPGGSDFCKVHKCEIPTIPIPNPAKRQVEAAKEELRSLARSFDLTMERGLSICECAARQAINDGHLPMTVFVATGGVVRTGPVADWQAAMRKAMPACRESNP
jgi:hypothetical protein